MRRAAKRDISEGPIVAALRALGWSVLCLSQKDVPDLLLARSNQPMVLAEVKTGTAKLKPGQVQWAKAWPGPVVILRSVQDAIDLSNDHALLGNTGRDDS